MKIASSIGVLVIGGVLIAISGLGRAFVGITLYRWFALPLGLPLISMGQLFGLMYLIGVVWQVSPRKSDKEKDKDESFGESLFLLLVRMAGEIGFPLLFGWIIKLVIS